MIISFDMLIKMIYLIKSACDGKWPEMENTVHTWEEGIVTKPQVYLQ